MITVSIPGNDRSFEIDGHSDFSEAGTDIICASVSSAAYLVANTITDVLGLEASIMVDDGYMQLILKEESEEAEHIIQGLRRHISQLSQQYPDNVVILN